MMALFHTMKATRQAPKLRKNTVKVSRVFHKCSSQISYAHSNMANKDICMLMLLNILGSCMFKYVEVQMTFESYCGGENNLFMTKSYYKSL